VRAGDLAAGRIRFPASAKSAFPSVSGDVDVVLRGVPLTARWNPRLGPHRERSGTLAVARRVLARHVSLDEVLTVSKTAGRGVVIT
jgi:hypothetical protein